MHFSQEIESPISAARMFKAAILDWYNLGPKLVPEIIVSGSIVEGECGLVGETRLLTFSSVMPFSYVKERLDFVDHEKFECKCSAVDGGHLGITFDSAYAQFKIEPTSSGGCIIKVVQVAKLKDGAGPIDDVDMAKEWMVKLFKTVETYLLANPNAYV